MSARRPAFSGIVVLFVLMTEPEPTERRTLKSRPTLILLLLIGSCYAFGYTIFRLLKGMQQ